MLSWCNEARRGAREAIGRFVAGRPARWCIMSQDKQGGGFAALFESSAPWECKCKFKVG